MPTAELPNALWIFMAALLGLIVGSFLNVVILRLPKMLAARWERECREHLGLDAAPSDAPFHLALPPSHCPACGHRLRAWENIPLLSWLWLRGRCAHCATPISARYPLVEALTGLLSAVVVWHFGPGVQAAAALVLTWALIALAGIDWDQQLLPDDLTLPLLWLGLLLGMAETFTPLPDAVLGAVGGYVALWLLFHGFRLLTGKEGLGRGDFKLFAALGAWMGWQALPLIALLSSGVGIVLAVMAALAGRRQVDAPIPFGPFLAIGGWMTLLWGEAIWAWYGRVSGFA